MPFQQSLHSTQECPDLSYHHVPTCHNPETKQEKKSKGILKTQIQKYAETVTDCYEQHGDANQVNQSENCHFIGSSSKLCTWAFARGADEKYVSSKTLAPHIPLTLGQIL